MTLEVLVTSMFQSDFSLCHKMNLQTKTIIANQCEKDEISECDINGNNVKMISTTTRGLSRNRNIAIANSSADIVLFADDDIVFDNNFASKVLIEFQKKRKVEAIKFNLRDLSSERKLTMKPISKFERANRKNMSSSGVCAFAIKRSVLIKFGILFNENFGAGTENFCGEDTIFIQELLRKRIKIYRSPTYLGGINQEKSSWFKGYNENYFCIIGKVFAVIFPLTCRLLAFRSSIKFYFKKRTSLSFFTILKSYNKGITLQKGKK